VPVAKAKDVTVSADNTCTANASVNDGSSDADGDPLTFTQTPPGPYPIGTTPVRLTVTDPSGAASEATASVTVVDTTAPVVTGLTLVGPTSRPKNHALFGVTVNYNATDSCNTVSCVLSVTINDPEDGDDKKDHDAKKEDDKDGPDFVIVDAHHVLLRADRSGKGDGRTFTITVTCTDAAGNVTVKSARLVVPH
jgi:hypothetical protein